MKASWLGIYDRGNISMERVHFRANVDIDLQYYAVLDTQFESAFMNLLMPDRIQAGNKSCWWFNQYQVKAGHNIVLYTRAGAHTTETRPDGSVFHFFFRGLPTPIYGNANKCAVIFELNSWITTQRAT
jgi:hypothetical protein